MINVKILPLLLLIYTFDCASQNFSPANNPNESLNFEQALSLAKLYNPDIISQNANLAVGNANVKAAEAGWLPSLQVNIERPDDALTTANISVRQPIYGFGKIRAPIDTRQAELLLIDSQLQGTINGALLDTSNNYIDYWINTKRQQISLNNITALEELYKSIDRREKGDFASQADVLLASSRLNQARVSLNQLKTSTEQFRLNLIQLIQHDVRLIAEPKLPYILSSASDIELADILTNNPNVTILLAQIEVEEKRAEEQASNAYPSVYVAAEKNYNQGLAIDESRIVLGIESSLDNLGFSNFQSTQAALLEVQQSKLELESIRSRLRQQYLSIKSDITLSEQILTSLTQTVSQLEQTLKSYKRQFAANRKSWLEVLNMQRELSQQQQLELQIYGQYIKQNIELISLANNVQQLF